MEKSAHKLELLKRIAELEKQELWHLDVKDDPETYPLMPDNIDYLNEKLSNKIKNKMILAKGLIAYNPHNEVACSAEHIAACREVS